MGGKKSKPRNLKYYYINKWYDFKVEKFEDKSDSWYESLLKCGGGRTEFRFINDKASILVVKEGTETLITYVDTSKQKGIKKLCIPDWEEQYNEEDVADCPQNSKSNLFGSQMY